MEEQYSDEITGQDGPSNKQDDINDNNESLVDNSMSSADDGGDFYNADESESPPTTEKEDKVTKKKFHEHIAEIQRIKYQALKENEALRAENERLSMLSNASAHTALQHYEEAASQRLQAAKEFKQRAYDSGDIKEQIDADIALSLAVSEIQTLNQKKAEHQALQQPYYQGSQQQQQYQQQPQYNQEIEAKRWVERNQWFNPASESYDDWMATEMHNYCNALDNNLYRAGLDSKIMGNEYFETIDNHARALADYRAKMGKGDLNMRGAPNTVSPVRGNGGLNQQNRQQQVKLSPDERNIARKLGLNDETYLQYKIADMRHNGDRR
jgi:hypothetical protein